MNCGANCNVKEKCSMPCKDFAEVKENPPTPAPVATPPTTPATPEAPKVEVAPTPNPPVPETPVAPVAAPAAPATPDAGEVGKKEKKVKKVKAKKKAKENPPEQNDDTHCPSCKSELASAGLVRNPKEEKTFDLLICVKCGKTYKKV